MESQQLLIWLEKNIGFESYQNLEDRSLTRIAPFFADYKKKTQQQNIKIVTVAGTNGKGQTCYALSEILTSFNLPHAMFISPHVNSITERFQHEQGSYSCQQLFDTFEKLFFKMQQGLIKLSYFEFLFAVFLEMVLAENKKYLILEVGVGGRLDATNLLDADVAVVTSIGRDHQGLLGTRLDKILDEKLGIIRQNKILLTAFSSKYLLFLTQKKCEQKKVPHLDLLKNKILQESDPYWVKNRTLALWASQNLLGNDYQESLLSKDFVFERKALPGRGDQLKLMNYEFTFYGSHNLDGMRAWIDADIEDKTSQGYAAVLMAFSERKWSDIKAIIKLWISTQQRYAGRYQKILLSRFEHQKAFKPNDAEKNEITSMLANSGQAIEWLSNWKEFIRFPTIETNNNKILVIGSFYFAGEVKKFLKSSES